MLAGFQLVGRKHPLVAIKRLLPRPIKLHPNLHTPKNRLLPPLEVNPQLQDIPIIDGVRTALLPRRAKPDVVEERAAAALDVLDVPLPVVEPELAVPARHDLALEAHGVGVEAVRVARVLLVVIAVRVAADADDLGAEAEDALDGGEGEGFARGAEVDVGGEADGGYWLGGVGGVAGCGSGWRSR